MAILAYDDVMLREPRLLVPGMQPVGNVCVQDKRFSLVILGGRSADVVNGLSPTSNASTITKRPRGLGWFRANTEAFIYPWNNLVGAVTVIYDGITPSNVNTATAWGLGDGSSGTGTWGARMLYVTSQGYMAAYIQNNSTQVDVASSGVTGFTNIGATCAMTWKAGSEVVLFIKPWSTNAIYRYGSGGSYGGTILRAGCAWRHQPTISGTSATETTLLCAVSGSALSEPEICAYLNDPYSLLIPA